MMGRSNSMPSPSANAPAPQHHFSTLFLIILIIISLLSVFHHRNLSPNLSWFSSSSSSIDKINKCSNPHSSSRDMVFAFGSLPDIDLFRQQRLELTSSSSSTSTLEEEEEHLLYFQLGLVQLWGFNYVEAHKIFERCTKKFSSSSLCYYGLACAHGPNLNRNVVEEEDVLVAKNAMDKATSLVLNGSSNHMMDRLIMAKTKHVAHSVEEWKNRTQAFYDQEYVDALSKLLSSSSSSSSSEFEKVVYAEALMNLTPWRYALDSDTTRLILALLSHSSNPLALHLLIHVVEQHLPLARSLGVQTADALVGLMNGTGTGHLVHMPSHVYLRVGEYAKCAIESEKAVALDVHYENACVEPYAPGHNLALLTTCAMAIGDEKLALRYSSASVLATSDDLSIYLSALFPVPRELVMARFGRWRDILELHTSEEEESQSSSPSSSSQKQSLLLDRELTKQRPAYVLSMHSYTHTLALIHTPTSSLEVVEKVLAELSTLVALIPEDELPRNHVFFPFHRELGSLMNATAHAAFLVTRRKSPLAAIPLLLAAVQVQDSFFYMEPENHYVSIRQCLGVLYSHVHLADLAKQELDRDLLDHPNNVWASKGHCCELGLC